MAHFGLRYAPDAVAGDPGASGHVLFVQTPNSKVRREAAQPLVSFAAHHITRADGHGDFYGQSVGRIDAMQQCKAGNLLRLVIATRGPDEIRAPAMAIAEFV